MNLHPYEMVRPDNITRSGIIQPFSVRAMDPVQYARAEINPFINAIRPQGATINGGLGLGIVSPEVIRSLGQASTPEMAEQIRQQEARRTRIKAGVVGAALGVAAGVLGAWLVMK